MTDVAMTQPGPADAPMQARTVCAAFQRLVAQQPDKPALGTLDADDTLTWSALDAEIRRIAGGLAAAGVRHGDTVAMMLGNVRECHATDLAAVHLGAVPFTIYNSSAVEQICYQLGDADSAIVICQQAYLDRVLEAREGLPNLETIVVTDGPARDGVMTFDEFLGGAEAGFDFDATWQAVGEDDLVTLIYTSGTTGPPKGAQWSHRTVMSQLRALGAVMPLPETGLVSFLPMAHAGGRIAAHYMALPHGATILCCPDLRRFPEALAAGRPDAMFTVPRIWEKLRAGIEATVAGLDDAQRAEATAVIDAGATRARAGLPAESPAPVLVPVLRALGLDRLRVAFIGGAPSAPELSEFFRGCGVPLLEAYGSTECGLNVFNRIEDFRGGTAGKPLPGVEVHLAEDGELLIRAELNMVDYRNRPDQTAETIDADGWLHTGDIAEIDDDGFVRIVDRKKEIIISAAGKNMSPANIEAAIKPECPLIGQVAVIGDGRRYVTALIALDPEAAGAYAATHGLDGDMASVASDGRVLADIASAVDRGNQKLSKVEQVKKHRVLADVWAPDSDVMTPTMKLKRRMITTKYDREIEALYAE